MQTKASGMRYTCIFALMFSAIILLSGHDATARDLKFGSDIDKKTAEISPGGVAIFELSLINPGNDMITVSVDVESVNPLKTYAIPQKTIIPGVSEMSSLTQAPINANTNTNTKPKKWYLLNDGVTHVPVYSSYIYVEVPREIYYSHYHNYTLKVHVTATTKDAADASSIKENIAQIHEYELSIILNPDFVNHIKPLDETINLNYHSNGNEITNIISSGSKAYKREDGKINGVIYVNQTQSINDSKLILPAKISGKAANENSDISINSSGGQGKAIIDASTIIVLIISAAVIFIAIRV